MKKILIVVMATLALNFLVLAGGVGWLFSSGRLDKEKVKSIREIVLATQPATQEAAADATTKPATKLEELTAKKLGRTTVEQVQMTQHAFDVQMVELDRRKRELEDLQRQVDLVKRQSEKDRAELKVREEQFAVRVELVKKQETDKGFADALAVYSAMPARQAKEVFLTLDDATVRKYLQAMEPRAASKIIKEFKSNEELRRIQQVVEGMRLGGQEQPKGETSGAVPAGASSSASELGK